MFSALVLVAVAGTLDPAAMLHRADAPYDAFPEGVIRVLVSVSEAGKDPAVARMDLYVKGRDRSLCVIRDGKQKGRKILTVGDKVWLVLPTATKPVPVSKSQRLMGAASFADVASLELSGQYEA